MFATTPRAKASYETAPVAVCVSPVASVLFVSNSKPDSNPRLWGDYREVYIWSATAILGKFGKAGKRLGEFSTIHEIDCRNPDQLYVSEISAWRAQKIILNSKPAPATAGKQ